MTPHQVSTGSSLLSVLVIRGRSCRIGGSIRARGGSVIPLPLITTGGVRTVARCRSRTTSYVGRQYRQAAVLDFNYGSPARHGAESGAAIFLHYATRYTAGCVSMDSLSKLTNTLRWIDPAQNPKLFRQSCHACGRTHGAHSFPLPIGCKRCRAEHSEQGLQDESIRRH